MKWVSDLRTKQEASAVTGPVMRKNLCVYMHVKAQHECKRLLEQ